MPDYGLVSLRKMQENINSNPDGQEQKKLFAWMFGNMLKDHYNDAFIREDCVYLPIGADLFQCDATWLYGFFVKNPDIKEVIQMNSTQSEIKLFYESQKPKNTFLFDDVTISILLPMSQIAEVYQIFIYPIRPRQNTQFLYIIKQNESVNTVLTEPGNVFTDIWLGDFKFRASSIFNDGKINVQFNLYQQYQKIGVKFNIVTNKHRSTNKDRTGYGHVCINNEDEYHFLPILVNNGNSGLCDIVCAKIKRDKQNIDKEDIYLFSDIENAQQIDNLEVLPYWTDKFFCVQVNNQKNGPEARQNTGKEEG